MNIEDIKKDFITLLRDTYDAKQYQFVGLTGNLKQLAEAWSDSDTDLIIGKKVLSELGFSGEVFREVTCPALEREGVLEGYQKYSVDDEEYIEDFPYQFKVNKKKLFEGSGRVYPDVSSIFYKSKEKLLVVDETKIPIKGPAQHEILSIIFNDFNNEIHGDGVFFDEVAEKYDNHEDIKNGSRRVENSLRQVNGLLKDHNFHIAFDLKGKRVKLEHN